MFQNRFLSVTNEGSVGFEVCLMFSSVRDSIPRKPRQHYPLRILGNCSPLYLVDARLGKTRSASESEW